MRRGSRRQVLEFDRRPRPVTTRRSMTFSSSRTLPGHEYSVSAFIASGDTPLMPEPFCGGELARKWSTSTGMSSRRSRSGGTTM